MDKTIVLKSGQGISLSHTRAILGNPGVLGVFSVLDVADCFLGTERDVTIAKKEKGEKIIGTTHIRLYFWRLSLSDS